ncbi:hypothetical protein [Sphingobacterium yanglingense]|uniref:hypothetical protein n=1 Tax=Sphingobacterium yanglingense TaxID=1437280 RepID=UPI00105CDA8E|nr:hypothetical protein [Sphingobacterium yanglingense]
MGTTKHCKTKQQVGQTILAVSYNEALTILCLPEKRSLIDWKHEENNPRKRESLYLNAKL